MRLAALNIGSMDKVSGSYVQDWSELKLAVKWFHKTNI